MKIAVAHLNLRVESGDPRWMYPLAQNIKKAGHEVVVYTAAYDPNCFADLHKNLEVREVPSPISLPAYNLSLIGRVLERLKREYAYTKAVKKIAAAMDNDFDIVIMENDQTYKLCRFYRKFNPRAKFIWVMHNAPFRHTKKEHAPATNFLSWAVNIIERVRVSYYAPFADKVVIHDEEQRKLCQQIGVIPQVLPMAVDFEKFYQPVPVAPSSEILLLGIGSLSPARNYEDLLQAGLLLRKQGIACRIAIVCTDLWKNDRLRQELLAIAKQDSDGAWVDFYFDGVTEEALRELHKKAFVFVLPTHVKIWSQAAMEVMAAGKPVVVGDVTSVAEALKDNESMVCFRTGHPEEIVEKITFLVKHPQQYLSIARAGQDFVRNNLAWGAYIKQFLAF